MELSIIIPVYNVQDYLARCLDSFLDLKIPGGYEILVVNDGTKDDSQQIIDEYCQKDSHFISFIKENGGISSARNFGLERARGEYVTFVDSDDYVEKGYYEALLAKAKEADSDLVVADLEYVFEQGTKAPFRKDGLNKVSKDIRSCLMLSPLFAWNKLYKLSLFKDNMITYPLGVWYEDVAVSLKLMQLAIKPAYLNEIGIHYVQRSSSIMGTVKYSPKFFDIYTAFDQVFKDYKELGLFEKYQAELEYLLVEHIILYGSFRFFKTEEYRELITQGISYVKERFPSYKHNPYLKTLNFKNRLFIYTLNPATLTLWHQVLK